MTPSLALAFVLALVPASRPAGETGPVRLELLSLLSPQSVVVRSESPGALALPNGGRLEEGETLTVTRDGKGVAARAGAWRWRGERLVLGDAGRRLEFDVRGRDRRSRDVRGEVTIDSDGRELRIVAEVALEDLVASGVAAEFERVREPAALEAAAIAIRSYVVANRGRHAAEGFDLCDNTHCLFSRGLLDPAAPESPGADAAVAATRGLVLERDGRVVAGYFTACCGGRTSTPAEIWGGEDSGDYEPVVCTDCRTSKFYRWTRTSSAGSVAAALSAATRRRVGPDASYDVDPGPGGWVRSVVVRDDGARIRLGGDAFRMAVERRLGWNTIPSPRFAIDRVRGSLRIRGGGFGHGVGLCVEGAVARADRGESRDELLRDYFPRARVALLR